MKMYAAKDVDAYIVNSAVEARPHLKALRGIIKSAIPTVEEKISWGVPFYWYHGALVGFATFKNHVSFGLGLSGLRREERDLLERKGYVTGSKIVQIRFDQNVPTAAIKRILKEQARMNASKDRVVG